MNSSFKFTKPKIYNGERNALIIDNWIFAIKEYIDGYEIKGAQAVKVAASFTDGLALQFWRTYKNGLEERKAADIPGDYGVLEDVAEFLQLIRNKFFPSDYTQNIRDKLFNLSQVTSARDYVSRFEEYLYQLPANSYHDEDMKDLFTRRLKSQTRMWVLLANPTTLQEAMRVAERCDDVISQTFQSKFQRNMAKSFYSPSVIQSSSHPSTHGLNGTDRMEVDTVKMERSNGKHYKGYQGSDIKHRTSTSGIKCYNCNKIGHYSRNCKEAPTQQTLLARSKKSKSGNDKMCQ